MTSTHRAENIFSKYLLYYVNEIAQKYPREKYRYSSFSDSVVEEEREEGRELRGGERRRREKEERGEEESGKE